MKKKSSLLLPFFYTACYMKVKPYKDPKKAYSDFSKPSPIQFKLKNFIYNKGLVTLTGEPGEDKKHLIFYLMKQWTTPPIKSKLFLGSNLPCLYFSFENESDYVSKMQRRYNIKPKNLDYVCPNLNINDDFLNLRGLESLLKHKFQVVFLGDTDFVLGPTQQEIYRRMRKLRQLLYVNNVLGITTHYKDTNKAFLIEYSDIVLNLKSTGDNELVLTKEKRGIMDDKGSIVFEYIGNKPRLELKKYHNVKKC